MSSGPFLELVGPLYSRRDAPGALTLGMRLKRKHANARGVAHGGMLMTFADVALGYATSVSADFAGAAKIGDWIEARVDIQRLGSRVAFANTYLTVGERRIVRVSAVFVRESGQLGSARAISDE